MKTDRHILRKCAIMLALVVSGALMLEACAKEPSPLEGTGIISMTTKATKVWFSVEGTENIAIDWGDGKKSNAKDAFNELDKRFLFTHDYSGTDAHSIVITGSNITMLNCRGIGLTSLDVSRNTVLTYLACSNNQLTVLDVSRNTALNVLECDHNQISKLDVSKNTVLWELWCVGNQLTAAALNDLFRRLPYYPGLESGKVGNITISYRGAPEAGNPGNRDCDRSIAEKKGWIFHSAR
jgi:hypothetical protein